MKNMFLFFVVSIFSGDAFGLAISKKQDLGLYVEAAEPFEPFVGAVYGLKEDKKKEWKGTGSLARVSKNGPIVAITAAHCLARFASGGGYLKIGNAQYPFAPGNLHIHPAWNPLLGKGESPNSADLAWWHIPEDTLKGVSRDQIPILKPLTKEDMGANLTYTIPGLGQAGGVTSTGVEMASVRNTFDVPALKAYTTEGTLTDPDEEHYKGIPVKAKAEMKRLGLEPLPYLLEAPLKRSDIHKQGHAVTTPGDSGSPVLVHGKFVIGVHSAGLQKPTGSLKDRFKLILRDPDQAIATAYEKVLTQNEIDWITRETASVR